MLKLKIAYLSCGVLAMVLFRRLYLANGLSYPYAEPSLVLIGGLILGFAMYKKSLQITLSDWSSKINEQEKLERSKLKEVEELTKVEAKTMETELALVKLYEMTKIMSANLRFDDIFNTVSEFLRENFSFRKIQLVILKKSNGSVEADRRYRLWGISEPPEYEARVDYKRIVGLYLEYKKETHLVREDDDAILNSLGMDKDVRTLILLPLLSEKKLVGIMGIENLLDVEIERFRILAIQFALQIKRALLYETIEGLAITDGLTSLYVRRYFLKRLNEELNRSKRYKFKFACIMADIDDFKKTNDTFGHLVGDVILKDLSRTMKESVREIDIVARYGGEEFSLILPETGREGAMLVAERIRKKIEENIFRAYDENVKVTVSIGVSIYPEDADNLTDLIECVDRALYAAKARGKNVVCEYRK